MLVPIHYPSVEPAAALVPVNLAVVDAAHLVRILTPSAQIVIDCASLPCQRTLGVCFLVSQLLLLRQGGISVWLRNVNPVLLRCLHKLNISSLFFLAD